MELIIRIILSTHTERIQQLWLVAFDSDLGLEWAQILKYTIIMGRHTKDRTRFAIIMLRPLFILKLKMKNDADWCYYGLDKCTMNIQNELESNYLRVCSNDSFRRRCCIITRPLLRQFGYAAILILRFKHLAWKVIRSVL